MPCIGHGPYCFGDIQKVSSCTGAEPRSGLVGLWPLQFIYLFIYFSIRVGRKKKLGPPNIGQPAPPCSIFNYSPKPSSNILPNPALVLGFITLCTSNKTSWPAQVQTLKVKLHFLFISKNPSTNPRNPFLYFLFFCFVFFDTLSFALVQLPTYQPPKLQSSVLTVRKKKKKILTNFFFLHQL